MVRAALLLLFAACANPSQGVAIDRVVPAQGEVNVAQPVTLEGTFHVLTSNLDEGDTAIANVTASVGTMPLPATWMSQDQISAMMPGLAEGSYDVTVSLDGRTATLKDGYVVGTPGTDADTDAGNNVTTHQITVVPTIAGGPHIDFPLLVDVQDSRLRTIANGGEVATDAGADIFFSSDAAGTMKLAHELEKYGPANGELVAWVKIPSLDTGTVVFLHSGGPATTPPNPAEVWSNGYGAVWHMGALTDATGNGNGGVDNGTVGADPDGQIEGARSFNGTNSAAGVAPSSSINDVFMNGGTAEAWFFPINAGANGFGRVIDRGPSFMVISMCDGNGRPGSLLFARTFTINVWNWCTPSNSVTFNAWNHVAIVYDDSAVQNQPVIFINGTQQALGVATTGSGNRIADDTTLEIGDRTGGGRAFNGSLDEIRLSHAVRSAEWIRTTFANQNNPNNFARLEP